jgi:hypothetical protein
VADARKVRWLEDPEEKDYEAARSYLWAQAISTG